MSHPDGPQVSWKVLEPGAAVVASGGEEAGNVTRIVGDADADVFTGVAFKHGLLSGERLVPSERVSAIWETRVEVELTKDELDRLPEYEDAPVVRLGPDSPGFFRRLFGRR